MVARVASSLHERAGSSSRGPADSAGRPLAEGGGTGGSAIRRQRRAPPNGGRGWFHRRGDVAPPRQLRPQLLGPVIRAQAASRRDETLPPLIAATAHSAVDLVDSLLKSSRPQHGG